MNPRVWNLDVLPLRKRCRCSLAITWRLACRVQRFGNDGSSERVGEKLVADNNVGRRNRVHSFASGTAGRRNTGEPRYSECHGGGTGYPRPPGAS